MHRILLIALLINAYASAQGQTNVAIIPAPVSSEMHDGYFLLSNKTTIKSPGTSTISSLKYLEQFLKSNFACIVSEKSDAKQDFIEFEHFNTSVPSKKGAYQLTIAPTKITISADSEEGWFYGVQSLLQVLPLEKTGDVLKIPCLEIYDFPRFEWRGMHLDCSRHFFAKDSVKKYLATMALYKMNVFHWHLTDDQGWRIQINKYPKLTEIGSKRSETVVGKNFDPYKGDGVPVSGFYTQADIKEVVAYAQSLHITIVPEIEMPGHSLAALAAYPQYSCTGGPFEVLTKWGTTDDVYCPTEETFHFLEDILTEVISLFPGDYIHIGGDEVPKTRWKTCPHCQQLITDKHLKNEEELQSYFIRRIDSFLTAKGKKTIGWDEILEGGLAPNATVMSWRGTEGGIAAAKLHHQVVMCPGGYCYFDHYQGSRKTEPLAIGGYTTVEKVYSYDPTPASLSTEEQAYIIGAQGNVWTEYIPTYSHVEYMAMPRMLALSEALWTPAANKNYSDFKVRLLKNFDLLDKMHVNYSRALFDVQSKIYQAKNIHQVALHLYSDIEQGEIKFNNTGDGGEVTAESPKFQYDLLVDHSQWVGAANFINGKKAGKQWEQDFSITKSSAKDVVLENPPAENYSYGGAFTLVDGVKGMRPWYSKEWLGFKGTDCIATIDLNANDTIHQIMVGALKDEASWIYLPSSMEVWISSDGQNFTSVGMKKDPFILDAKPTLIQFEPVVTRFVKVKITNSGMIPAGKPGEGEKAWLFVDEIGIE